MTELTTVQWVLIGTLGTVQVGLFVAGLIAVVRTPAQRLTAPKVVWVLICFVQFVGPIVFFVAGRKPAPATAPAAPASAPVIGRLVAELYPEARR